jgi:hypothetical protein
MVGRCQRKTRLQREGGDPNVILRDGRSSLAELSGDAPVNLRSGLVGGKHVHCFQEPGDLLEVLFRTSGTESTCLKFGESRLRQVKFLVDGDPSDQCAAVTEVANTNTGIQQDAATRSRHESGRPSPPARSPRRPNPPCNPPWPTTRHGGVRGALGIEAVDVTGHFHQLARR